MTGSREGNLVLAALFYAADCVAEGDADRLRAMGLGIPDAAGLCSLTLEELRRVGAMCGHALEIRFDPDILRVVGAWRAPRLWRSGWSRAPPRRRS